MRKRRLFLFPLLLVILLKGCYGISIAVPQDTVIDGENLGANYDDFSSGSLYSNFEELKQNRDKAKSIKITNTSEQWTFARFPSSKRGIILGAVLPIPLLVDSVGEDVYEVDNKKIVKIIRRNYHSHWYGGVYSCWIAGVHGGIFPVCGKASIFFVNSNGLDFGLVSNSENADPVFHGIMLYENKLAIAALEESQKEQPNDRDYNRYLVNALHYGNITFANYLINKKADLSTIDLEYIVGTGNNELIDRALSTYAKKYNGERGPVRCLGHPNDAMEKAAIRGRVDIANIIWRSCLQNSERDTVERSMVLNYLKRAFTVVDRRCYITKSYFKFEPKRIKFYATFANDETDVPNECRELFKSIIDKG